MPTTGIDQGWGRRAKAISTLFLALTACAPHRPGVPRAGAAKAPGAATAAAVAGEWKAPQTSAFSMTARVTSEERESRRMKIRFYAAAPDRFRVEVRGTVGGIALVATGRGGKVRIVVPSRRLYSEGAIEDDLGSGLVGVSLTGCDLAMVMRISSGFKKFQPCGGSDPAADEPPGPNDRPGLIVDASPSGKELIRFGWDWSGEGAFPKEMRVESVEASASPESDDGIVTTLALTDFKALAFPTVVSDDFYWEPPPNGATLVPVEALAREESP